MGILKALLRIFSYLFGGLLALFLLATSTISLLSGGELNLNFLPWTGKTLSYWLLGLAFLGLVTVILAIGGRMRFLFFLWCLGALVLVVKGMFVSLYRFTGGAVTVRQAFWLTLALLFATIGSFPWPKKSEPVRRPQKY